MGQYLKITAGFLLLVQAIHLASLQDSTDSPGRTINISWLRDLVKNTAGSQNTAVTEEETEYEGHDANATDSSNEYSSGKASGYMGIINGEERNVSDQDQGENGTSDDQMAVTTTTPPAFPTNVTTKQPEFPDATVSPTTATTDPTNSSQINMTEAEEEFKNFTTTPPNNSTHLSAQNSTSFSDSFNRTNLQTTTLAPKSNTTQESTTKPVKDTGITNASEFAATTTTMQELNKTSTMPPSTTVFPPETTETSPATTSANAPITPEKANKTDKGPASGDNSERGVATDTQKSKRNGAWGAVLGMGVAVAFVALVAYVILKKKQQKGFSHRKLVEEYPSDPVLRLGNNEHLDLDFGPGRSAYYNPALQGDNIQMSNIP